MSDQNQDRFQLPVRAALGEQGADDPGDLVCERDSNRLVEFVGHKPGQPRSQVAPRSGLLNDRQGADHPQRLEPAIALLGDQSEFLLAAAGQQARLETKPGGEVAARRKPRES